VQQREVAHVPEGKVAPGREKNTAARCSPLIEFTDGQLPAPMI